MDERLVRARENLEAANWSVSEVQWKLAMKNMGYAIVTYLEDQSQAQSPTTATPSSQPDTRVPVDGQNGSNTFSETYSLVKADPLGEWRTTVTVTFHEPNFTPIPGGALRHWQDDGWTLQVLSTWGAPLPFGATQSQTPEAVAAGPTAGGSEKSPDTVPCPDGIEGCAVLHLPSDAAPSLSSESGEMADYDDRWNDGYETGRREGIADGRKQAEAEARHRAAAPATPSVSGREYIGVIGKEPLMDVLKSRAQDVSPEDRARIIKEPATPAPAPEGGEEWEVRGWSSPSGTARDAPFFWLVSTVSDAHPIARCTSKELAEHIVALHNASIAAPEPNDAVQ